jgi:phosphinothricin acetyltransferase
MPIPIEKNNHENLTIRLGSLSDLGNIVSIYNQAIKKGWCTADTETQRANQKADWLKQLIECRNIFVAQDQNCGKICGYFYFTPWRAGRKALEKTWEYSIYLEEQQQGKGLGQSLTTCAIQMAQERKWQNLLAILLDRNPASLKLLERNGFKKIGHLTDVAFFPQAEGSQKSCGQYILQKKLPNKF